MSWTTLGLDPGPESGLSSACTVGGAVASVEEMEVVEMINCFNFFKDCGSDCGGGFK